MLRTYGVSGLKAHIRNHVKLGLLFHSLVLSRPDLFRVPTPPAFALTVLTVVPRHTASEDIHPSGPTETGVNDGLVQDDTMLSTKSKTLAEANRVTKEVYELINSRGEIFLTSGVVEGMYAIRVVSANPKTEEKYIRRAFDILVETAEEVLEKSSSGKGPMVNGTGGH